MCKDNKNEITVRDQQADLAQIAPGSPAALMMQMAGKDGKFDVEGFGKMLEYQERFEKNEARKAYHVAMAAFHLEAPKIIKTKQGHNCKHADLAADLVAVVAPKLSANGLSHSWVTKTEGDKITVTCKITHVLGHSEETTLSAGPDTSGSKNSIQAVGSTITYLQRYTLKAALGLAEADQDDDGAGADKKPTGPKGPTAEQDKIMDTICEKLAKVTGKKVIRKRVAGIFLTEDGGYPENPKKVVDAAEWLIGLERQSEWAEENDMPDLMKTISQAYFEFETLNQAYLQNEDGKVEFTEDMFIKAVTKAFGTLPIDKTIEEIVAAVKPEDVAVMTGE